MSPTNTYSSNTSPSSPSSSSIKLQELAALKELRARNNGTRSNEKSNEANINRNTSKNYSLPYTSTEIENFEKDNNIKFPSELRMYLTQFSRDLYKSNLDFQQIKLDKSCIRMMPDITELSKLYHNQGNKNTNVFTLCTISNNMYSNFIILSGPYAGTVWAEYFAGDGIMSLVDMSFLNYSRKKIDYYFTSKM